MYIRFWERFPNLIVGTTTKNSGNFALSNSKIQHENIYLKRNQFSLELGFDHLLLLSQTHSDIVINADISNLPQEGDAFFTSCSQKLLGILTADCMPIFIYHPKAKIIGLVHSGRQGLQNKITNKTLLCIKNQYDIQLKDIYILIGPHICAACYSLDSNILSSFGLSQNEKTLDMSSILIKDLIELGISCDQIELSNYCTYCSVVDNEPLFYSHRNGHSERILSFIGMI